MKNFFSRSTFQNTRTTLCGKKFLRAFLIFYPVKFFTTVGEKSLITFFLFTCCFLSSSLWESRGGLFAQAPPPGINYQAIARDPAGNPMASTGVTVIFNIHRGSPGGPVSMSETHNTSTNLFGLFNLIIGSVNTTAFDTIGWGKSTYFLEVIVNSNNMGTTQFISVPYAFHAHTADSIIFPPAGSFIWKRNADSVFLNINTNNVGIGTSSPTAKLNVATNSASNDALNVTHKGTGRAGVFWTNNSFNDSTTLTSYTNGKGDAVFGINQGPKGHGGVFAVDNSSSLGCGLIGATNGSGKAVFGLQSGMGYGGVFWINNPTNDSAALVGMTSGNGPAVWGIAGNGNAGVFQISNPLNSLAALIGNTAGSGAAVSGLNSGTGYGGVFQITNASNSSSALFATTNGSGNAVYGLNTSTSTAGNFEINNATNSSSALVGRTNGSGSAVFGINTGTWNAITGSSTGTQGKAGDFQISNAANWSDALYVSTIGTGNAIYGSTSSSGNAVYGANTGTGKAGYFQISNSTSTADALFLATNGINSKALYIWHIGATGTGTDYGAYVRTDGARGAGSTNVGGYFTASGATNNYAGVFDQGNVGIGTNAPNSTLHINGSMAAAIRSTSAATTLTTTDYFLILTGGTAFTITLPAASTVTGRIYIIKNTTATNWFTSVNYISATNTSTNNIPANTTIHLISDGTNWQGW